MPSDQTPSGLLDMGLLSPVTVGHDALVSDGAVLAALVDAEVGLLRAWAACGDLSPATVEAIVTSWTTGADGRPVEAGGIDAAALAEAARDGGNPVIPLVGMLRRSLPDDQRVWVHRGATSQDILDTALMLVSRRAVDAILRSLRATDDALVAFAERTADVVAAGRTLGQHAVPTTVGLRAVRWLDAIRRAQRRVQRLQLPAQLGGAAGTRASFVELAGAEAAAELPARFAEAVGLDDAGEVWHTSRWPVTELADALTQVTDALGKLAGDVVTLSRTEIAELSAGAGGGSSAMPQKSNPVTAVLIRSAALRAPNLAATLHLSAALAADERPAGAWHAEWPTLRELLRLALGAGAQAERLASSLEVDREAVARNLAATNGLILAERLSIVLGPLIGAERVARLVAAVGAGAGLAESIAALPEAAGLDLATLVAHHTYLGEAEAAVGRAIEKEQT